MQASGDKMTALICSPRTAKTALVCSILAVSGKKNRICSLQVKSMLGNQIPRKLTACQQHRQPKQTHIIGHDGILTHSENAFYNRMIIIYSKI